MRLLNVDTLEFRNFQHDDIPPYFVTSHRWSDDEASYKDVLKKKNTDSEGYQKIKSFCKFAQRFNASLRRSQEIKWIWIDTCCIDQSSSAEVSESINSMWRWYTGATHCLAYLRDVRASTAGWDAAMFDFRISEWFTRGWTLQELLAPPCVIFLTQKWEVLGTRSPPSGSHQCPVTHSANTLNNMIEDATGIPEHVLSTFDQNRHAIDKQIKMAWAANRRTTRPEDAAYCLLGIFDVHMPLIYGEGERNARRRLEQEVEKSEQDQGAHQNMFPYFAPAQRQPLVYRRRIVAHQSQNGEPGTTAGNDELMHQSELCQQCNLLLREPVTTSCNHTVCESCLLDEDKFNLVPVPLDLTGRVQEGIHGEASTWNFQGFLQCPVCSTVDMEKLLAYPNVALAQELRAKYPKKYAQRLALLEQTDDNSIQFLTIHVGNWHNLVKPGHHHWSFFIKPSRTDIIKEVHFKLHETFPDPHVTHTRPPYMFHGQGWGYFMINVLLVLQSGYVWLSNKAQNGPDGTPGSTLQLSWMLDFNSFNETGAQGKCRVKVKKTMGVW